MCNDLIMNKMVSKSGLRTPSDQPALAPTPRTGAMVKQSLASPGRISGLIVTAAPTVVFVVANALTSLNPAVIAAALTALATFGWRSARRQRLTQAVVGLFIVGLCAGVAAVTGQARGFFLVPALIPFVVIAACVVSILAGKPLTGLILNRISGGPPDWYRHRRLRRVHTIATGICATVNIVNATLQVVFYLKDNTWVLAAAHIATGPIFATIVAVTIVFARRAMPRR
jgi:intracellular septation protein A